MFIVGAAVMLVGVIFGAMLTNVKAEQTED